MLASEARLDAYRALPTEGGPAGKDLNAIYAACMIRKLQKPDPYAFNWSWAGRVSLPRYLLCRKTYLQSCMYMSSALKKHDA